jgi:hypothetical protein
MVIFSGRLLLVRLYGLRSGAGRYPEHRRDKAFQRKVWFISKVITNNVIKIVLLQNIAPKTQLYKN